MSKRLRRLKLLPDGGIEVYDNGKLIEAIASEKELIRQRMRLGMSRQDAIAEIHAALGMKAGAANERNRQMMREIRRAAKHVAERLRLAKYVKKLQSQVSNLSKEGRAIGALLDNPGATNKEIATVAGCHVKSLNRFRHFMAARELLRRGRDSIPSVTKGDETGQIEA